MNNIENTNKYFTCKCGFNDGIEHQKMQMNVIYMRGKWTKFANENIANIY